MSPKEADDLQAEVDAKVAEGDKILADDPDLKDEEDDTADTSSTPAVKEKNATNVPAVKDNTPDDGGEGGFIGFVKKYPLGVAAGAGALLFGVYMFLRPKKKKEPKPKGLSGTKTSSKKTAPKSMPTGRQAKNQSRARKAKIEAIRLG